MQSGKKVAPQKKYGSADIVLVPDKHNCLPCTWRKKASHLKGYMFMQLHIRAHGVRLELDRILPGGRLQRFDFINDPITTLAPYILGYRRAGTRVYYNDLRTMQFGADERNPAEGLSIISGSVGAAANTVADMVGKPVPNLNWMYSLPAEARCVIITHCGICVPLITS